MRGILIPADPSLPIQEIDVGNSWRGIGEAIATGTEEPYVYIERTPTNSVRNLLANPSQKYPSVDLWVDEEGLLKQLDVNPRACLLSSEYLAGNAVLLGEDLKYNEEEGFNEPDAVDLPYEITVERVQSLVELIFNKNFEAPYSELLKD